MIINSEIKNVAAKIQSIDQYGLMMIQFNCKMTANKSIPWINRTSPSTFNVSWINSSNTNIYIEPAMNRDQDQTFRKT